MKLVRLHLPRVKSHAVTRAGKGIGYTLFHFRCITAGCGVPDCTTVARRVPLILARSTCQLDCSRNVGHNNVPQVATLLRHDVHSTALQPLSHYPFRLYRYLCRVSFLASGEPNSTYDSLTVNGICVRSCVYVCVCVH